MGRGRCGLAGCLARVALAVGVALRRGAVAAVVTRACRGRALGLAAVALGAGLLRRDAAGLEDLHLAVGELAPRAFGHVLELQTGKVTAVQADMMFTQSARL